MMRTVCILGATGTIGVNTLDVIRRHRDKYQVAALTAYSQVERLYEQCLEFEPHYAVMVNEDAAGRLEQRLRANGSNTEVLCGMQSLETVASLDEVDTVMAAIVGAAGLMSSLAAARAGKRILLANKEALVMSGQLFMDIVKAHSATLLPIDSEHNAIFQCMHGLTHEGQQAPGVRKILLTGSGGPLRTMPLDKLSTVKPEQAIAHPNWNMGRKISVDSATMMNKGLEIIEACWLFDTTLDNIDVVLHPQSIIHSMVEYIDGSIIAQLGQPDMRTPIAHALAWPERIESGVDRLDMLRIGQLSFESPDEKRYPCLALAKQAMQMGGTASAILNAANEIAVQSFLDGIIHFTDIAATVEYTLLNSHAEAANDIQTVMTADENARGIALDFIHSLGSKVGRVH
jgi:1-deoxy-D-xylulose-5-phosphate reductoisomerase